MDESDLETEEPCAGPLVDQLGAGARELGQCRAQIAHFVRNVVHARAALREEASDRRVLAERFEQLDPAVADPKRRRPHALIVDCRAMLDLGSEKALVGLEGGIEIVDSHAEMMNAARLHAGDATQSRRLGAV